MPHRTPVLGDIGLRDSLPHPLNTLTALEIRTLVLVYERNTAKDIARIERVTPDAVVARINRARSKLGGISRLAAARQIVAALQTHTYHSVIPHPMGVPDEEPVPQTNLASLEGQADNMAAQALWKLPIPTKVRPVNDDSLLARLVWPIVVAVLIVVMMAILQAVMVGIDRLRL
jgi:DNA-binding CsgD family transcriptional regulator